MIAGVDESYDERGATVLLVILVGWLVIDVFERPWWRKQRDRPGTVVRFGPPERDRDADNDTPPSV